jgi:ABC-2 type transport system permease protein
VAVIDRELASGGSLHVRQPRIRHFVRLKLRIMGNGMRGKSWRIVLFIFGILGGLAGALLGFSGFATSSFAPDGSRAVYATFAGTGVVLAWVFVPLLFFGVDETLDPARFALLPLRRRTLAAGMLAAACVGIPPVVTLVATLGSVTGAAARGGLGAASVAVLGAVIGLLLCVAASRAVTSAFASMLRSRRVRDLAAVVIAVLGVSCGPLQRVLFALIAQGNTKQGSAVSTVLSWTPLGAPYVAYVDAVDGHWLLVPARLAIGLAGVALLLWWWSRTIESAMVGAVSGGRARTARSADAGPATGTSDGPVAALFPRFVRGLPKNRFGGLVARELRYWWRHPRRRAGLISLLAASIIIPFGLRLSSTSGGGNGFPLPVGMMFAGVFVGLVLVNQFGTDGSAYGLHLLTGVPGHAELRSRAVALGVLTLPLLLLGAVAAALFTNATAQLPAALGTAAAAFGSSVGVSGFTSVVAPYPLPESTNPFAVNNGGASAKGLLSFVGMIAGMVLTAPLLIAFFLLPHGWRWPLLPIGVAWGLACGWIGTYAGGALLDRRAPEVLNAVTPQG